MHADHRPGRSVTTPSANNRLAAGARINDVGRNWQAWLLSATALLLLARLGLMWFAPLADTTEARYGEIARQAVSNGFWLMPHMDPQTPFFAKPPLSTWSSAAFMTVFGVNEFAARLPALLVSLGAIWIAMRMAAELGLRQRWLVIPVLASSPLFFASAGAVMTDAVQMGVVLAAQYCAWQVWREAPQTARWRLAFWAMVGLGALSKGLATWVLIALPLASFAIMQGKPVQLLRRLADTQGVLLALAIFLPWYIAAEARHPGFLNYFIVGEHFARFLQPGWMGDRYGTAHRQPLGAIWIFWTGAILPWIGVFGCLLLRAARRWRSSPAAMPPLECLLWCATLTPLLFFTFSRNIIWTYALTAIPPFAVLAAQWLENSTESLQQRSALGLAAFAALVLSCAPLIQRQMNANSERELIQNFLQHAPAGAQLNYQTHPAFSSAFYSQGALCKGDCHSKVVVMDNQEAQRLRIPADRIRFHGARRSLVEVK
ncbi:glycosyltransferase family 39 protein [Massilia sp. BJB1822]|uniref:ArnT family glycosyltransferase n=1 Tax=Massilia sp. BJB1822 TaxID=2744470 RepID=UPI0015946E32|nr:glycosyltransferase family 39 protein [Massilia sp. BJB1822]NVE01280.1 glycosyltransferase family 39 protein [Massilia sp. BJB1822]